MAQETVLSEPTQALLDAATRSHQTGVQHFLLIILNKASCGHWVDGELGAAHGSRAEGHRCPGKVVEGVQSRI